MKPLIDIPTLPGGLLAPPGGPPLRGLLQQEPGLKGNMFGPLPPLGPLRMWPEETPDDLFWQRFHDEQLYRGMRREDIPPRMREQIPIEVDPPDKPWWMPGRRLISGLP